MTVHVLLLAAGRSSRTGGSHKLLARFDDVPLIRRSAETALDSRAGGVTVVVGHRAEDMRTALHGLCVEIVYNPAFGNGMSTSLVRGFRAVGGEADGILVMLADQPRLSARHLDRLIDAFRPEGRGSLVVATDGGEWLNPVVISRRYQTEISKITGDKGAKSLFLNNVDSVVPIEIGRAARVDVDTLDAIRTAGGSPEEDSA